MLAVTVLRTTNREDRQEVGQITRTMSGTSRCRRAGDQASHWLLAARVGAENETAVVGAEEEAAAAGTGAPRLDLFAFRADRSEEPEAVPQRHGRIPSGAAILLLDLGVQDALLISGAAIRKLPRLDGGKELLERASNGAQAWARVREQTCCQLRLPERLTAFADALADVEREADVFDALLRHTASIVGGYSALLLLRRPADPATGEEPRLVDYTDAWPAIPHDPRFRRPGIIRCEEARADTGAPLQSAAAYFDATGAVAIAHVPFGEEGVLCVSERRRDRHFEPEHWDLFRSICRQAASALQRVRSLDEVKRLSLTDPLTGIGNRRRLEVAVEQAWAAARRGEPLSVLMMDLDHFKRINDIHGHAAGDKVLRQVGSVLKEEARGSDIVVRYGGDEFLVVLRGTGASGAYMLAARVRERLRDIIGITVGFAEYHPSFTSAEELISAADRHMYQLKRESGQAN